ncbi:50S ribosomal protein L10 [bacterium]|nr:50S ribosomal protein L10 [bacterium]MBU3955480.1 50S ribosomal protein L10 [bacterium]
MKLRAEKVKWLEDRDKFVKENNAFIFADFQKMTVKDMTELRMKLGRAKAITEVVKNRLFKKLMEDKWEQIASFVQGPTAVVFTDDGQINEVCKTLAEFSKNNENFKVKGGFLRPSRVLTGGDISDIAVMPDRDTLIAMFARAAKGPIYAFHNVCKALLSGIVFALSDYARKKGQSN